MLRVLGDAFGCTWSCIFFFDLGFSCPLFCFFERRFRCAFLSWASFSLFIRVFPYITLSSPPLPFSHWKVKTTDSYLFQNRVSRRKGTVLGRLSFLLVILLILANILITTLLTAASMANYPGGHALALLHSLHPRSLHNDTRRKSFKRLYLYYAGW